MQNRSDIRYMLDEKLHITIPTKSECCFDNFNNFL